MAASVLPQKLSSTNSTFAWFLGTPLTSYPHRLQKSTGQPRTSRGTPMGAFLALPIASVHTSATSVSAASSWLSKPAGKDGQSNICQTVTAGCL